MEQKQLVELISNFHELIGSENFEEIDNKLSSLDMSSEPVVFVAYLRSTVSVKDKLKKWESCRNRVALELIRRDLDAKSILIGLMG